MSAAPRVLVIGVGTPERGADAAGRLVAERLQAAPPAGVTVLGLRGDALTLMEAWAGAEAVVLVDAVVTGAPPGSVHRFDASERALPARLNGTSSHDLGLADALELSRALASLPRRVIVIGIEGDDFSAGAPLSPPLRAALETAAARAASEARALTSMEDTSNA